MAKQNKTITECYFDEFAPSIGGCRVDELIDNTDFDNADYLFRDENIIVELKCLQISTLETEKTQKKLWAIYKKMIDKGIVSKPENNRVEFNTGILPDEYQEEFFQVTKQPIVRLVKKANKQIKETKTYLNLPDAKGLLLISNEGNYGFPPGTLRATLGRILNSQNNGEVRNSSIHATMQITNSVRVKDEETNHEFSMICDAGSRYNTDVIPDEFLHQFVVNWSDFIEQKTGVPSPRGFRTDIEALDKLRLIKE